MAPAEQRKIMAIMGTRPEAIKMAPLIQELQARPEFKVQVCVTAQHREMLDQVLDLFKLIPDYDLDLMMPGQSLTNLTSQALLKLSEVIGTARPHRVLVHGDTTTTLAGSLAAFYNQVPIGHVEAGLRTHNLMSPWPEEGNRQLTSRLANMHFAPTATSKQNLLREGVLDNQIFVTGNSVIDALVKTKTEIKHRSDLRFDLEKRFPFTRGNDDHKMVLVTAHRRENFGDGIRNICAALKELALNTHTRIVFPVHPNPNIRDVVNQSLRGLSNVELLEPLDYVGFVYLLDKSYLALTDSGGVQEEAPSLGKPVLVMRETTERPEAVEAGTVRLVGSTAAKIVESVQALLANKNDYAQMSQAHNPYGDGLACRRIVDILAHETPRAKENANA